MARKYWYEPIVALAEQLPTGIKDPNALQKLYGEMNELHVELMNDDLLGAILEAADVMYYAAKAIVNDLLDCKSAKKLIFAAADAVQLPVLKIFKVALVKYGFRAQPGNPKDDAVERELAVQVIFNLTTRRDR